MRKVILLLLEYYQKRTCKKTTNTKTNFQYFLPIYNIYNIEILNLNTKLPMLNKYGDFFYALCTFQGVTSHQ